MVRILWHRTVVRDGWHNAFTDLCSWRGSFWLTFRRGSAHVSLDGEIVVMRSQDLKRWREVALLKTLGDDRDPKFCPTEDRLYVYFGTWMPPIYSGLGGRLVSHACTTQDGVHWSDPTPIYKSNVWLWRVRFHGGTFYCPAKSWDDPRERRKKFLDLLTSDDGLTWEPTRHIAGVEDRPDEADLLFRPNQEIWCISRSTRKPDHSLFYVSQPPYQKWERTDLKIRIHCPVFCESQGQIYVAGRRDTAAPWTPQSTPPGNTGIFLVERRNVQPLFALPSDGDAAYPGLITQEAGKLIISYYSQHAYRGGVVHGVSPHSNDVYLAEIATE